ncbi:hypothetical protein CS022_10145 [Veronia nyctiphanis]|uniref:Uncharacterized protein n=1 Tax=Veronia nyctiphanis TaxID=1278244 RepID=A0A4Q0YQL3_9GAMM|nr:hypothetical protein [Veronia nyctiphanis]RXJ73332.1 hypothetical protein CS022_10145 [Veronia nyctiphanis]
MIRRTLFAALLLLVLLLAILLMGLVSPYGLNALLWTAERFVPEFNVDHSEGALLSGFTLSGVRYTAQGIALNADELNLTLSPKCLRHSELCVDNLSANDLTLIVKTAGIAESGAAEENPSGNNSDRISLPFPVSLKKLELNNITLEIDGNRVYWQQFRSAATFSESLLIIEPTMLSGISVALPEQPKLRLPPQRLKKLLPSQQHRSESYCPPSPFL